MDITPEKEESAPEPVIEKKSYKERQAEWIKENNLKPGDKVRILRKTEDYENGWQNGWTHSMEGSIGEICTVIEDCGCDGIEVKSSQGTWGYPYFVLEKAEDKPAYIPFDLSDPKDRDFLRGKWIKQKDSPKKTEMQIIGFRITEAEKAWCCDLGSWVPAEDLLTDWVFLDGSPVGRPANGQQMASK